MNFSFLFLFSQRWKRKVGGVVERKKVLGFFFFEREREGGCDHQVNDLELPPAVTSAG